MTALNDTADASLAACYEYGPFGELLRASCPMAKANPFHFSTKYTDNESGLVYFPGSDRILDPPLGRWLQRDPANELGFRTIHGWEGDEIMMPEEANLYAFVSNDPVNKFDPFGLAVVGIYGYGSADKLLGVPMADQVVTEIASSSGGRAFDRSETGSIRKYIKEEYKKDPKKPIILFGYSRGAVAITEIQKSTNIKMQKISTHLAVAFIVVSLCACTTTGGLHNVKSEIAGRAINVRVGNPLPSVKVVALDSRSRTSYAGIPAPIELGSATTNMDGIFKISANGKWNRRWIAIAFKDISNVDAMNKGWRIEDVVVTSTQ